MKIEVRNVKINQAFSQETLCFTADVFIDGVKAAHARMMVMVDALFIMPVKESVT